MPRTARASIGGLCYHVINRGNNKARVYHSENDYRAFMDLIGRACERTPMRVLAYCLMPNHFHLVMWPYGDGDLSHWMHWLLTVHVRHYHRKHGTSGRVWQGRFKAFPIQDDRHLLTVLRYVERNPLRANLVARIEEWPWSSIGSREMPQRPAYLQAGPVARPRAWAQYVNEPLTSTELDTLHRCIHRSSPFGGKTWVRQTAADLGLESSLRPVGRPKRNERPAD